MYFSSPPGFVDLAKYRVVDMYTSVTVDSVKEQIVKSFCNPNGKLRVVVCTVGWTALLSSKLSIGVLQHT